MDYSGLTQSQSEALSFDRHLAVIANAGSGKTHVMTLRYVDMLVETRLRPANIVAITFTEKAASELRKRIIEEIGERIAREAQPAKLRDLTSIRRGMASAPVTTIHSFASRLLRAYPVEAKVDPSFTVMQSSEQEVIEAEEIERVLFDLLTKAFDQRDSNAEAATPLLAGVIPLAMQLGRYSLTLLLKSLVRNRRKCRELKALYDQDDDQIFAVIRAAIDEICDDRVNRIAQLLAPAVREITKPHVRDAVNAFTSASDQETRNRAFSTMAPLALVKSGLSVQKCGQNAKAALSEEALAELKSHYSEVTTFLDYVGMNPAEFASACTTALRDTRSLLYIYDHILTNLTARKEQNRQLDFDDIIEKVSVLLERPDVRADVRKRYPYLIIDEYQDTNEVQYSLARQMAELGNPDIPMGASRTLLGLVGDPKQAIYRFQGADVKVFLEAIEAMAHAGGKTVRMQENFRMAPVPLAFVNKIFSGIFDGSDGIAYDELIQGRTTATQGSVEILITDIPKKKAKKSGEAAGDDGRMAGDDGRMVSDDGRMVSDEGEMAGDESELAGADTEVIGSQSELIARRILKIVDEEKFKYQIEEPAGFRDPQLEDIAILIRARGANLTQLQKILKKYKIPFRADNGESLWQQQEILDFVSFLSFLCLPSNDVACAAVLRSPFFNVSDIDLLEVAIAARREGTKSHLLDSFWSKVQRFAQSYESEAARTFAAIVPQIESFLELVGRVPTRILLDKILLETPYIALVVSADDELEAARKLANIDKFCEMVRTIERAGFVSFYDLVRHAEEMVAEIPKESTGVVETAKGAVTITTIHGAKGLEYPIVFTPFLEGDLLGNRSDVELDGALGIGSDLSGKTDKHGELIRVLIARKKKTEELAEKRRLFYVALTRARDHLILTLDTVKNEKQESFKNMVKRELVTTFEGELLEYDQPIRRFDGVETSEEIVRLSIPLTRKIEFEETAASAAPVAATPQVRTHYGSVQATKPRSRYSASAMLDAEECLTKYYFKNHLKFEPEHAGRETESDDSERLPSDLYGSLFHGIVEKINSIESNGQILDEEFNSVLKAKFNLLGIFTEEEAARYRKRLRNELTLLISAPIYHEIRLGTETETEFPIQGMTESGDILYGIIDRLFVGRDGVRTVLDYKTGSPPKEGPNPRYERQLMFYASLVQQMFGDNRIRGLLYYSQSGETQERLFTQEDLTPFRNEIGQTIKNIAELYTLPSLSNLGRNTKHCRDCSYYTAAGCMANALTLDGAQTSM